MAQPAASGFVIKRSDPRRRRSIIAGLVILLAAAALAGYLAGRHHGAEERDRAAQYRALMTDLQQAYTANARLRDRVAALERSEQVARNANSELKDLIVNLQDKLAVVRGDLSLYQGMAAGVYEFTLMLTQNLKQAEVTRGEARIILEGSRDGRPARLGLEQLQADSNGSLAFSFKYFQMLEGSLTLPEDFQPGRVLVRLDPEGNGETETAEADFDWSAVVKTPRQRALSGATGP